MIYDPVITSICMSILIKVMIAAFIFKKRPLLTAIKYSDPFYFMVTTPHDLFICAIRNFNGEKVVIKRDHNAHIR